ncbi:D-alanyl-D-alanine carboxypeptidase [Clostridium sp. 'deep sea']|uniref:D-alanyl-D-alanine carboxypeptidase family protein n=1 Tax=Clostridium sp. 'deep sea' TaxID=2779445 RepID=UPI001896A104|nr:D-alanyl-D-alanine carboxypeptidase family protein [Clostridium sp. 'deep sea']QOR34037.1 D-alanyl-D-alanine carboxypeptidase [Clostridium sp. 'deep sea']
MKKTIIIFLAILYISSALLVHAQEYPAEVPKIKGQSAIVIDAKSHEVIYSKNENQQKYPASTTKMLTAILVLENCNLHETVTIDFNCANTEGSSIYLQPGEQFTVEQLLYALLLESANDVAESLACHVSGSVAEFGKLMTLRAKELGAINSNFVNPHGLPNKNHYTTAADLAKIALHAITIEKLIEISSTARYQIPATELYPQVRYLKNSNRFLWGQGGKHRFEYLGKSVDIMYPTILGIKTGYTKVAGNCFVSYAKKENRSVISVVLKSSGNDLYRDTRYLVDYGLYNYETTQSIKKDQLITNLPVKYGLKDNVDVLAKNSIFITNKKGEQRNLLKTISIANKLQAPIKKGTVLGELIYTENGKVVARVNLVSARSVSRLQIWWIYVIAIVIILFLLLLKNWSKKKYKQMQ